MMTLDQAMQRIQSLEEELVQLRLQMAWLKKKVFGGGQGESLDKAQLTLALGILEQRVAAISVQKVCYERVQQEAKRVSAPERFEKLPVKETIELTPEEVKADPDLYEKIGEERTFEVDIVLPQLVKREIIRGKYRHRLDRSRPPVVAAAPARAVSGGYASAGLLAWVMIAKYVEHLPLYRQEKQWARQGVRISRQTMVDWVAQSATWLQVIYREMYRRLLAGGYLQCDETPIRCQDPDVAGKTVQGWLWVLGRPKSDVVFHWRMSREHAHALELLRGYKGLLQSDGYPAYENAARENPEMVHLGCWAHARRYFTQALEESPVRAGFILRLIGSLYHWERTWDEQNCGPALRAARRRSHFALTLSLLKRSAFKLRELVRPKSALGEACTYLLNHWDVLVAHCDHGRSRLDNNLIENAIRPSAIGKKNWMFIGHPEAGDRSAIIYSIVVSCQRHGIDPFAYIKDVLTRLPRMTNQEKLDDLLPSSWKPLSQSYAV